MSVWTTKSLGSAKDYIVIKHKLRGVNYVVNGVRFRDGYAVVEKGSKTYNALKKIPVLQNAQEYPLLHLRKLKFITRAADVRMIYGQDVYRYYAQELAKEINKEKVEEVIQAEVDHVEAGGCGYRIPVKDTICGNEAFENSPSGYCKFHILDDPRLLENGIKIPKYITKQEKAGLKEKVIKQLNNLKIVNKQPEENKDGQDIGEKVSNGQ